eukprot:3391471-Amphidinium_carterae.2
MVVACLPGFLATCKYPQDYNTTEAKAATGSENFEDNGLIVANLSISSFQQLKTVLQTVVLFVDHFHTKLLAKQVLLLEK